MGQRSKRRAQFRRIPLLAAFLTVLLVPERNGASDGPNLQSALRKQNLDLPYDAGSFSGEAEDEASQVHAFYGQSYEADAIAFALDKSGSMDNRSRWQIQTREVAKSLREMTARAEFGIVYYGSDVRRFKGRPVKANPGNKTAGVAYVKSERPQGDTCIAEGVVEALRIVRMAESNHRAVIVTSDGRPDVCATGNLATGTQIQRLLQKTLAANPGGKVRVHTIYVGSDTNREAVSFLRRLALAHSGTFRMASR